MEVGLNEKDWYSNKIKHNSRIEGTMYNVEGDSEICSVVKLKD